METPKTTEFAHIGKSVIIKGELSGSEDLYVDGKGVTVQGKLDGNIRASERAELTKSAIAVGDIITQRIAIEEGAYFKGKIDIQKDTTTKTDAGKTVPAATAS